MPKLVIPASGATNVQTNNGQLQVFFDFYQLAAGHWSGPVISPAATVGTLIGPQDPGPNGQLAYQVSLSGLAAHTTYKVGFAPPSSASCDLRPPIFIGSFTTQ